MNCISEILVRLRENRIKETTFTYQGSEYSNRYGNYTKNRRPISKEEYHRARKNVLAIEDEEGSISQSLNLPNKKLASEIEDLNNFISKLEYDEDYEVFKETRGHIDRIDPYDEESRIDQIIEDTGMSENDARATNRVMLKYTSTDNYKRFSDSERVLIDNFIDNSPTYMPPPLYRGLGFGERLGDENSLDYYNELLSIEEGTLISFRDYTSFSSNPDVAVEFAHSHGEYHVYLVNTKNLTGVSIDHLSSISYQEDEVLYKSDVKMSVKYKEVSGNIIYFHVEEVPLEEDDADEIVIEIPISGSMSIKE